MSLKSTTAPKRISSALSHFVLCWLLILIPLCGPSNAQIAPPDRSLGSDVRIGVLGLFHPHEFTVSTSAGSALVLHAGDEKIVLEKSSGLASARISASEGGVTLTAGTHVVHAPSVSIKGRRNEPVDFMLAVPGKITRRYHGALEIKPESEGLIAIISMDREIAVASIVAAESTSDTPLVAMEAQAIATRSYLVAGRGRHREFDFCDTTHCQFLRQPPAPGSAVAKAVAATRDLVLAYDSKPFAAMFTRSCSGRTRTPAELGLPTNGYPYYPVECAYCRAHPSSWSHRVSAHDAAALRASDESARLSVVRRLGWSAVPSNNFVIKDDGDQMIVNGTGSGHGIGLCQAGARAMAEEGSTFREILAHYFPNAVVTQLPKSSR